MFNDTILPARIPTVMNYHLDSAKGGMTEYVPGSMGSLRRKHDTQSVQVTDIRACAGDDFGLDTHGFQFVTHTCSKDDFEDDARIAKLIYPECAELLKSVWVNKHTHRHFSHNARNANVQPRTGATKVQPFSHIVRRGTREAAMADDRSSWPDEALSGLTYPFYNVHIDQSYGGAEQVFRDNVPAEDAPRLHKTRWGIINIWRPIGDQVIKREPLAVCDAQTVSESDLVPVKAILPNKDSNSAFRSVSAGAYFETWELKSNPAHRWYYASDLRPDEAILIKCFDSSRKNGRARRAPHSAFARPQDSGPPRQSCEVRCLVFWEDEAAVS